MKLTTENKREIASINETYFNNKLSLNIYGNIADLIQFQKTGQYYLNLNISHRELISLFYFPNLTIKDDQLEEIKLKNGQNQLFLDLADNSAGLILIGSDSDSDIATVEIDEIKEINNPNNGFDVWSIGDCQIDIPENNYIISTNRGRGVTTVSSALFNDKAYLSSQVENVKQASAIALLNLPIGLYSANVNQLTSDSRQNDLLLAYNGKELTIVAESQKVIVAESQKISEQILEIEIPFNYLYLIACDIEKTSGTTSFVVSDLMKIRDLDYTPPKLIPLTFNESLGNVQSNKNEAIISTGTGSRSVSTIIRNLDIDELMTENPSLTEGSYGIWNLANGEYKLKWQLTTSDKTNNDSAYIFDGQSLQLLATSNNAKFQSSKTRFVTEEIETNIIVGEGKLIVMVFDSESKTKTTWVKFISLVQISLE